LWMELHGTLNKGALRAADTVSSDFLPTQTISNREYDVDKKTAIYVVSMYCQYFGLLSQAYPHIWIAHMT